MLVLSRKIEESIIIGPVLFEGKMINISVKVIEISGGKIRLGVDAPSGVPVHREEVHAQITAEKAQGIGPKKKGGA